MKGKAEDRVDLYIVIADDNIEDHRLITRAVKECNLNHIVTSVYNGHQLLNLLLKQGFYKSETLRMPDLIILDLKMPILDGFGVLEEIRKYPELEKIPIYTLSDSQFQDDKERAVALGSSHHYPKPFGFEKLRDLMGTICSEIAARKNRIEAEK
jgi:CheY-like chemotaxis protein